PGKGMIGKRRALGKPDGVGEKQLAPALGVHHMPAVPEVLHIVFRRTDQGGRKLCQPGPEEQDGEQDEAAQYQQQTQQRPGKGKRQRCDRRRSSEGHEARLTSVRISWARWASSASSLG